MLCRLCKASSAVFTILETGQAISYFVGTSLGTTGNIFVKTSVFKNSRRVLKMKDMCIISFLWEI